MATGSSPYWNWYGFPLPYTAEYTTTQIVGLVAVGLVAAIVKPAAAR